MEERRRNRRMELDCKLIVKRLDNSKDEEVSINIVDISKSGAGFISSQLFDIGAVYEAYLTLWTKEVIHAFIEIVRIEKSVKDYIYGGIFVGMPQSDVQRIEVYETFLRANEIAMERSQS